jgi:hypothetical protein
MKDVVDFVIVLTPPAVVAMVSIHIRHQDGDADWWAIWRQRK